MKREQILRSDFPSVRKGWDPAAVEAHLHEVADASPEMSRGAGAVPSLADATGERVRGVIAAAEEAAAQIELEARTASESLLSEAREESDGILAAARTESDRLVTAAREEANARVEEARDAVENLIAQAGELRTRVGTLGEHLAGSIGSTATAAEVPGPVIVPEPTPPTFPEPMPDPVPEPMPDPVPEPTPPGPAPDLPDAPEPMPPVPEPAPAPPAAAANGTSTDDLIAQLRAAPASQPANGSSAAAPDPDLGAARLVAMNMTLDGASREEIATELGADFGDVPDLDVLLDEVFARAGR